jgi:flagellar protein FlaG
MPIQNVANLAQATQAVRTADNSGAPNVAVAQHAVKPPAAQQPSPEQLRSVVDNANKTLKQSNSNLEFTVDTDTQKTIVKLVDTGTGELIRQYPSKEMLAIAHAIDQLQQGALLKQKA